MARRPRPRPSTRRRRGLARVLASPRSAIGRAVRVVRHEFVRSLPARPNAHAGPTAPRAVPFPHSEGRPEPRRRPREGTTDRRAPPAGRAWGARGAAGGPGRGDDPVPSTWHASHVGRAGASRRAPRPPPGRASPVAARRNGGMPTPRIVRAVGPRRYVHRTGRRRHRGAGCVVGAVSAPPGRVPRSLHRSPGHSANRHARVPPCVLPGRRDRRPSGIRPDACPPVTRQAVRHRPRVRRHGARRHDRPRRAPMSRARRQGGKGFGRRSRPGGRTNGRVASARLRRQANRRRRSPGPSARGRPPRGRQARGGGLGRGHPCPVRPLPARTPGQRPPRHPGPRTNRPGNAPVGAPSRNARVPFTAT